MTVTGGSKNAEPRLPSRSRGHQHFPGAGTGWLVASEESGDQVRGPCPVHGSTSPGSRTFSANLRQNTFQCFKCGEKGNQLDLYVAVTKLPIYKAVRELCERAGIDPEQLRLAKMASTMKRN